MPEAGSTPGFSMTRVDTSLFRSNQWELSFFLDSQSLP